MNWLTYEERKNEPGLSYEGAKELLTEESLSAELVNCDDQDLLDNLREMEDYGVKVPAKAVDRVTRAAAASQKVSEPLKNSKNILKTPPLNTLDNEQLANLAPPPLSEPSKSHSALVLSPKRQGPLRPVASDSVRPPSPMPVLRLASPSLAFAWLNTRQPCLALPSLRRGSA